MFITQVRSSAAGADRSVFGNFWFQPVGMRTQSGARVTPASAMGNSDVFSAVKVLSESFAIMPFELYAPKADGGRRKDRKHWLYRLINKAPNKFQSPYEWRLMLMGHMALRGNAFCQITANGRGEILELLPLHPDRMAIEPLDNGSFRYVYTDQNGVQHTYNRHEIWHLRGMSDDGYMGMSPVALAREAIGEGQAMQAYSSRFFANDARPGGWIEYAGQFATNEAKRKFRDGWQELQGGSNRGKVAVLERGMKFHELGLNNKDSQFIEARSAKTAEIARIFRIPPHKLMELSKSTNNNIEHQGIEFWTDTMLPWATLWESSISFFLLGEDSDLEPDFDHKPFMRGDGQARAERIARLVLAGVMLRNEGREEEGLDPLPGLDKPLIPVNMAVVGEDGNPKQSASSNQPKPAAPDGPNQAEQRLVRVITGNAARMARRLKAGKPVDAAVLAEALGISEERAAAWKPDPSDSEEGLASALISLGVSQ